MMLKHFFEEATKQLLCEPQSRKINCTSPFKAALYFDQLSQQERIFYLPQ